MRELRFRAWVVPKYDSDLPIDCTPYMATQGEPDIETLSSFMHHYGNQENLMQYTGLKDKNGKDIYEGDIILIHGQESREVVFKHAFWMIENLVESRVLGGFGTPTDSGHKPIYRYGEDGMEVIGNIYENPSVIQCQQSTPA